MSTSQKTTIPSANDLVDIPDNGFFSNPSTELYWQMTKTEKYTLLGLLNYIKPKVAIEIGTYQGGSLQVISHFSEKVYCLDVVDQYVEALRGKFNNVHFRIGDSKETLPRLISQINQEEEAVNFVLIDGDHSEEMVKKDINAVLKIIPKEPVYIVFHDSFNPSCRKGILSADWKQSPYVHYVDLDYTTGVFYDKKYEEAKYHSMWGGLALAVMLPTKRTGELKIQQSQQALFNTVYKSSIHRWESFISPLWYFLGRHKVGRLIYRQLEKVLGFIHQL